MTGHEHDDVFLSLGERLAFARAKMAETERTVVCTAAIEQDVRATLGWTGWKIVVSPFCPPDRVLVIDENAIKASTAEALQHMHLAVVLDPPTPPEMKVALQQVLEELRKQIVKDIAKIKPLTIKDVDLS